MKSVRISDTLGSARDFHDWIKIAESSGLKEFENVLTHTAVGQKKY